jgi:L-amino acid N-acyltransferase YncA
MLVEKPSENIIVTCKKQHWLGLLENGHCWQSDCSTNLGLTGHIRQFTYETLLLNKERRTLIAYSGNEKQTIGLIRARRITEHLWGVWNIYVLPAYRGKRVGSLLLTKMAHYLKRRGVQKLVSIVSVDNIPSMKHSRRSGWKPLQKGIFECERIGPLPHTNSNNIMLRKSCKAEKDRLFTIYKQCVGEEWQAYLEMKPNSFLDRVWGPAFFEEYSPFSKIAMKKNILVAEIDGKIAGYALSRAIHPIDLGYALCLLVPMSEQFAMTCKSLLLNVPRPLAHKRQNRFSFTFIGDQESKEQLSKLGFRVRQFLVQSMQL